MKDFIEKHRKGLVIAFLVIAFLMIYVYNILTPYFSDDYAYLIDLRRADSLLDIVKQQYAEYLSNSARVIGQFNVRLSLSVDKQVFNVVNSLMFLALLLLIYLHVRRKKKHDLFLFLLILTFLWCFSVEFGQTMLWICGACNYLWGSVFILLFLQAYRQLLQMPERISTVRAAIWTYVLGVLAGWCNENTSGGALLLTLLFAMNFVLAAKKEKKRAVYPFMITGILGLCTGLVGMVMAPGVRKRSATMSSDETYTGIVGFLSRLYKVIVSMHELFYVLILLAVILLVILAVQGKLRTLEQIRTNETVLYFVAFLATSVVLAFIPTPADRAYFGAGVFLMIACLQGIVDVMDTKEAVIHMAGYGLAACMCVWLFFTYVENLVNVARIYREENERIALIDAEHGEDEDGIVVIPQFREEFKTKYSVAHESDLTDDKDYWINMFYEVYYDIGNITAIPRDTWEERYGED